MVWEIRLDQARGLYRETTRIEATEPVTLIGLRSIGRILPGGRLRRIWVDDEEVRFRYENILNLNLPPGRFEVVVEATWDPKGDAPVCLGPVYEGRKMSLPRRTDLRVIGGTKTIVTLRPIGLPETVWRAQAIVLSAHPEPLERDVDATGIRLILKPNTKLSLRPVILYEQATFPVLVCVAFSDVATSSTK